MKKINLQDKSIVKRIIIICVIISVAVSAVFIQKSGVIDYALYNHYIKTAQKFLEQGRYDEAIMAFNKAISIKEKNHHMLGDSEEDVDVPPVINAANKITTLGKPINLLSDVTAKDSRNKDLSKYVMISSTDVNFNEAGRYEVTYTVLDSNGMRSDKEIYVNVVENTKENAENTAPIIRASDKSTTIGKPINLLAGVIGNDLEDGDVTEYIALSENNLDFNKEGVYTVTYSVTDSGGLRTEKIVEITVTADEDEIDEGNNTPPEISAGDISTTVGKRINLLSRVAATDEEDGDLSASVIVAQSNVNFKEEGVYSVTYAVLDSGGIRTEKTISVTVKAEDNTPPVIRAENRTMTKGSSIDLMSGVTAKDEEDGDLTSSIKIIKNNVNYNEEGIYSVTYEVSDSGGIKAEKNISVKVEAKYNTPPVIYADNKTVAAGETINLLSGVRAVDVEDGDLTEYTVVAKNNVDYNKPGTYSVTYVVLDSGGIRTEETIAVTVTAAATSAENTIEAATEDKSSIEESTENNTAPVINATDKTVTVGESINLLSGVTSTDKEDGDLTQYIIVRKNNVDYDRVGTYSVTYAVLDRGGITTEKDIKVTVVSPQNNTAPVIKAGNKSTIVGQKLNLLSGVTATDKEDGDLTQYVIVRKSNVDYDRVGAYSVTYAVLDRGGITTEKDIEVTVSSPNNNTDPVIHASDKTVTVGESVNLLSGVTATDKEDGDLSQYVIVRKSNVDYNRVGTYSVTYAVLDRGGITTEKDIKVTVVSPQNNAAPVINAVDKSTTVGESVNLLSGVTATDDEDGDLTQYVIVRKSNVDFNKAGTYSVTYAVLDRGGITTEKSVSVFVNE